MIPPLVSLSYLPLRLAHNPLAHLIPAAPANVEERATLRYFADLFVPEAWLSTNFVKETTREAREKPPKTVGSVTIREGATIYYEDILEALLALESQAPDWDTQVITPCPGAVLPFRIESRVTQGVDTPVGTPAATPVYYALKGGLNFSDFADNATSFFVTWLKETAQFLTWQPDGKWIDTWQPEFLYLLTNFTPLPTELKLCVEFTFDDGTSKNLLAQTLALPKAYQVYCFPVGFRALELATEEITEGKQIRKYAVYVTNQADERISEVRTYQVDRRYFRPDEVSYWLYRNSLGGFDTLRCTGNLLENLVTEREAGKRFTPYNYGRSFGASFPAYLSGDTDILANTGYFRQNQREWVEYLQELFYSKEIYQLNHRGLMAVELVSKELTSKDSKPNTVAAKLKFRLSHQERNFSRMPRALPPVVRPTAWRFKPGTEFCVPEGTDPNSLPNWQDTGNVRCKFAAPRTDATTQKEQKDVNPDTNQGLRWVDAGPNEQLCQLASTTNATITIQVINTLTTWSVNSSVLGALTQKFTAIQHPVSGSITVSVPVGYRIAISKNGIVVQNYTAGPVTFSVNEEADYTISITTGYGNPR
jgi:hypothetical protein